MGTLRLSTLHSATEQGINTQGHKGVAGGEDVTQIFSLLLLLLFFLLVPITASKGSGLTPMAKLASFESPLPTAVRTEKLLHGLKFAF